MLIQTLRRWFGSRRAKVCQTARRRRLFLESLENRSLLATFMVTNTGDSGPGSLRQAIFDAESTPNVGGPDEIHFNIPGGGVHTIFPTSTLGFVDGLPNIIDPVIIDGYTQPGAAPNTLAVGDDAVLKIEINCSLTSSVPFLLSGNNTTVRGLAITHFTSSAFVLGPYGFLHGNANTIAGNFIGTDAAGLTCLADGSSRAIVTIAGSDNVFGGPAPADRNVITSPRSMFLFQTGTGNVIQGNYIGVNKDGTGPLQPPSGTFGVVISVEAGSNTIADNVILGTNTGISLLEGTTGHNLVQGNFIGTNATGTAALGGGEGIEDQGNSDTITGNVISGGSIGININHQGPAGPGPTIQGNKIGTDVTGTLAIPNSSDGINVFSSPGGATIGGANPGEGNTIANSGRHGVIVGVSTGCSILGNSIFASGSRGIRLLATSDDVQNVNDPGDGDSGPNGVQNYPVLSFAGPAGSQTVAQGTLNSTPDTQFRIEFFASDVADPSGYGEGQIYLGFTNVTTDAGGNASFTTTLPGSISVGQVVSATATDPAGNTSEFSYDVTAASLDVIIDAGTPQSFLDSLTVIYGNLIMVGVAGRTDLSLPNLTEVDGDFIVTGNPDLAVLNTPLLTTVGGNVDISNNPKLTAVNLGSVTGVGGAVSVTGNAAATSIDLGSLTTASGSVSVVGNTAATSVDLGSLTTASGSVSVVGNTAATSIDLGSLATASGSVNVTGNTSATSIDVGRLTTASGSVSVVGNTAATSVDLGSLATVGGDASVSGNTSMTSLSVGSAHGVGGSVTISDNDSLPSLLLPSLIDVGGDITITANSALTMFDVPNLAIIGGDADVSENPSMMTVDLSSFTSTGGSVSINGNTAATGIDVSTLADVGGSVSINGNTAATGIDVSTLADVGGSVSINGNAAATGIDLGSLTDVGGDESLEAQNSITSVTADGSTEVTLFSAQAQMTAALATGTFDHAVAFTVTRLDPATLPPQPGQDSTGGTATIDPLAAYQFHFDIPTLGQLATLNFDINLHALTSAERDAFLAALAANSATVAVKNDALGSVYQAFAISAPGQPADASHVTIIRLDASGNPLPAGSTATPSIVRFEGVTGHFSTFAVVIVSGSASNTAPVITSFTGPIIGVRGQTLHFTGSFSDPDANTWAGTVNFGDGTGNQPVTLNPDKTFALDHVFANSGRYSLVVNVADNHGGSASRSLAVSISAVALESDPASPRQTILAIGGTPGGDLISLVGRGSRGILVLLNGSLSGPYRPTSRVEVYGQAGNDVIQIAGCITTPARVFGGDGNDTIIGGDEADAFFGENGNDTLLGGGGNDSLDGGAGNDLLDGSSGNDALQGGAGFLDVLLGGDGNDVLSDPDGVRSASGGNGNDDMTLAFAANWNLSGSPIVPSSAISGGNGDDTIRLTSSTPELQFDVFGDNGKDRIELYGTWSKARVFGGNGTDTVKNRGIGQLKLSEIEIVE